MVKKFYRRGFLNAKDGTAIFETSVSRYATHLTLSDCGRQITLEFGFHNAPAKRARLKKMDLLISALQAMRAAMAERETTEEE